MRKSFLFQWVPIVMLCAVVLIGFIGQGVSLRNRMVQKAPHMQATAVSESARDLPPILMESHQPNDSRQPVRSVPIVNEAVAMDSAQTISEITELLDAGEKLEALQKARILIKDPDRAVRLFVIETFRGIGLSSIMDLAQMVDDSDREIRDMARDTFWVGLREVDDMHLKKELLELVLNSDDPNLRIDALNEVLSLPDDISSRLTAQAMNDPDVTVAEQAQKNLTRIRGDAAEK